MLGHVKRQRLWKGGVFEAASRIHSTLADGGSCVVYLKPVGEGQPVAATSRRLMSFVLQVVWNQGFLELPACPWDLGLEVISGQTNTADDTLEDGLTGTVLPLTPSGDDFEVWLEACHTRQVVPRGSLTPRWETLCWGDGAWAPGRSMIVKWHGEGTRYYKADFTTFEFDTALKPRLPGGQPVAAAPIVPSTEAWREWEESQKAFTAACREIQRRGKWTQKMKKKTAWLMFQRHEKLAFARARGAFQEIRSMRALFL